MPQVGFEPKIPVFARAKIVHALDRCDRIFIIYFHNNGMMKVIKACRRKGTSGVTLREKW
jgi:hypothetical protein